MEGYTRTDLKIKQPDGSFKKFSPTVTSDSVVVGNGVLLSSKLSEDGDRYSGTASAADSVRWSGVNDTPTNLEGYGITDAVNVSEVSYDSAPDKIVKMGSDGKISKDAIPQTVEITTFTLDDI